MFNRSGHKVVITKGVDKGAKGIIIDSESNVLYIQKDEGFFKEMYDTSNVYGFEPDKVQVTEPKVKVKDKVTVLGKSFEGESLPPDFKEGSTGVVAKTTKTECIVLIKGKRYDVPPKFLSIDEAAVSKEPCHNLSIKIGDIVFFKKSSKSIMAKVKDKSGINYELNDRAGNNYEVTKNKIFRKVSIKEMRSVVKNECKPLTKEKQLENIRLSKSLDAIRTIYVSEDRHDESRHYKKSLKENIQRIIDFNNREVNATIMSYKGYTQKVNQRVKKSPLSLKNDYWNFLCNLQHRDKGYTRVEQVLGVKHHKQGNVYTEGGTISKIAERLKSSDLILSAKSPFTNTKHIGVEIECFTDLTRESLNTALTEAGLAKNISLVNDRSIKNYGSQYPIEVRIIATEKSIKKVMDKTLAVLNNANGSVNSSCGLHVHLDMRNRNVRKCYKNLYNSQDILFKTSAEDRASNQFCKRLSHGDFGKAAKKGDHYDCISAQAYERHKTLEVRMHEGTLDKEKINNWISILKSIVDSKSISKSFVGKTFTDQLTDASKEDKEYFQARLAA